jgi:hypothetical protein
MASAEVVAIDSVTSDSASSDSVPGDSEPSRRWLRLRRLLGWRPDLTVLSCYALGAIFVTGRLWAHPGQRVLRDNIQDQIFFEWVLAHAARVVTHLENPFFTTRMNAPDGVNLIANTSVLGIGIPLTPVTLLFGPQISFIVFLTVALAGTAFAWYYVLSRHVVTSRWAAVLGGAFCGFAPSMISQATGHPNVVAQFLVPVIVWRVIRLREPGHTLRNGLILGLLITYQAFINQEILLFTALAVGVFVITHRLLRPEPIATFVKGLAVAGAVAVVLLAYPLYQEFFGPQSYKGLGQWTLLRADLASYAAFARTSLATHPILSPTSAHAAEETSYFGWPLLILVGVIVAWLRRSAVVRALAVTGAVFAVLSLGTEIVVRGHHTHIPGPWRLFVHLPVLDTVIPVRLALIVTPVVGVLLAIATDRFLAMTEPVRAGGAFPTRLFGYGLLAAALLPVVPTPELVVRQQPVPQFITSGQWRAYATDRQTVVPVPPPKYPRPDAMLWSATVGLDMTIPRGYFIVPEGDIRGHVGTYDAPARPTSTLLQKVAADGKVPVITAADRQHAQEDLRYWRAAVLVLAHQPHENQLRQVLNDLIGPGTQVADVWIWDVRAIGSNENR